MSDGITDAARGYHCKPDWKARALHAEAVAEVLAQMCRDGYDGCDLEVKVIIDEARRIVRQRDNNRPAAPDEQGGE